MPSVYLQSTDYAAYGVPTTTTPQQVALASSIIDGYLYRPEGLIWVPDANGNPCYMAALTPSITLLSVDSISPGQNINVTVTGGVNAIQYGLVAILDKAKPNVTEAVIINSVNSNVVQLRNIQFAHDVGCTIDFGLVIFEEKQMPAGRPLTSLSKWPIQTVLGGQGRYGYPRRSDIRYGTINAFNLLASITQFGGPPLWEIFDQTQLGIDPNVAEVWVPAGTYIAYYTEVRLSYIAGYTYASLPYEIKQACASIINSSSQFPMNGSIKMQRAGDTAIERFASTNLDGDTISMLNPYRARLFA